MAGLTVWLSSCLAVGVHGRLHLEVWDPTTPWRRDDIIYGSDLRLQLTGAQPESVVCIDINAVDSCISADLNGEVSLTLSGFTPGTHRIGVRNAESSLSTLIDVLPKEPPGDDVSDLELWSPPLLVDTENKTQTLCILSNGVDEHSQNSIFATVAHGLHQYGWSTMWFAPISERAMSNKTFFESISIQWVEGLDEIDWQSARRARVFQEEDERRNVFAIWLNRRPEVKAALSDCHLFWYANTFDDNAVAALAELASFMRPSVRLIMDLPNIPKPRGAAVDALVAPSRFAAGQQLRQDKSLPVAVVYPAGLGLAEDKKPTEMQTKPRTRRRRTIAYLGRLVPERSPGLFVRTIAALRSEIIGSSDEIMPGEARQNSSTWIRAIVWGDGPLKSALQKLSLQLGAGVRFPGRLPHDDALRRLRSEVDLLLMPRPRGETFGIANAEAACAGVTVIAYLRSGANESANSAGILLDSLEPREYATTVMHSLQEERLPTKNCPSIFSHQSLISGYRRLFTAATSTMRLAASPGSAYAAPLVARALQNAWLLESVVIDQDRPHLAIVGCLDGGCSEYWDVTCAKKAQQLATQYRARGARAVVFLCGEAWSLSPDLIENHFDLVVSTTTTAIDHLYLPVAATSFVELQDFKPDALLLSTRDRYTSTFLSEKQGVAYLYFRCRSQRETFYQALKDQQGLGVQALGVCGGKSARPEEKHVSRRFADTWHNDAIRLYEPFRFVVAFENSDNPGYLTEKMVLAFLAGAIPLYWGHSRTASTVFNSSAYIDCTAFSSLRACAQEVQRIDKDPTVMATMMATPPLTSQGLDILQAGSLSKILAGSLSKLISSDNQRRS